MRLLIVAVGTRMPGWVEDGFEDYRARMPRTARMELVEIKPEPRNAGRAVAQLLAREAQRIGQAVPAGALRVALDEKGERLSTRDLADRLDRWRGEAAEIAFIVGGPDGLDATIKSAARARLSLSAMTLPHALARLVLAEQLYRAHTLLSGHPYHRD